MIEVSGRSRLLSETLVSALRVRGISAQAFDLQGTSTPETLLVDGSLGQVDIRERARSARARSPGVRVLVWVVPGSSPAAVTGTTNVAVRDIDDLARALTSNSWRSVHATAFRSQITLTRRERDVMGLIAKGADTERIACHLGISRSTVRKHVGNVLEKLGTSNRFAAVARARQLGVLSHMEAQGAESL